MPAPLLTSVNDFTDVQAAYFFDASFSDGSGSFANTVTGAGFADDAIDLSSGEPSYRSDFGANSRSAIRLDNTVRGEFKNFQPYEGTLVAIMRPNFTLSSGSISPLSAPSSGTNPFTVEGNLSLSVFSGVYRVTYNVSSTTLQVLNTGISNNAEMFYAVSRDQSNRKADQTFDGTTITTTNATGATDEGNAVAISAGIKGRFGHLNLGATATAIGNTVDLAALIFIGGNAVSDQQTEMQALYAEAETYYGSF